jgi:hypothetical protein
LASLPAELRVSQYPFGGYCQIGFKTIPRRRTSARGAGLRFFLMSSQTWRARARCAGFCFRPQKF